MSGFNSDADAKRFLQLQSRYYEAETLKALASGQGVNCGLANVGARRAWDDLCEEERAEYIRAHKCMATLPARTNRTEIPGVRSRVDDFIWQHISQTNFVHVSGLLLPWHRQLLLQWENALRDECNYKGYQPYWPWERHAYNQSQSPLFQPGPNSFGTDGAPRDLNATILESFVGLPSPLNLSRASGNGGGEVSDGAFGNNTGWTLNLGPVTPANNSLFGSNNTPPYIYGERYNPRPLKRDILQSVSTELLNYTAVATLMQQDSIHTFHPMLENNGIHLAGHFYVGGDGSDIYSSPNEPTFWLHHASVDRLWTTWQAQDPKNRQLGLDGTVTVANIPPSENATLDTVMHFGVIGGDLLIRDAMSSIANGHCNVYV